MIPDWILFWRGSKADRLLAQLNRGEITLNQYRQGLGLEPLPPWREDMAISGTARCDPGVNLISQRGNVN